MADRPYRTFAGDRTAKSNFYLWNNPQANFVIRRSCKKRLTRVASALTLLLCMLGSSTAYAYYDDTHYSLTYYLARACGYTPSQAYRIASADISIDYCEDTEPNQYGKVFSWSSAKGSAQRPRIRFHAFMDSMTYPDCLTDASQQFLAEQAIHRQHDKLWNMALRDGNPGAFLHFLQDETSHAGYSSWGGHWASLGAYNANLPLGPTTDYLSYGSEERNMEMVNNTLSYLTQFMAQKGPKQPQRPFDQEAEIHQVLLQLRKVNPAPKPLGLQDLLHIGGAVKGHPIALITLPFRVVELKNGPNMTKATAVIERALDDWSEKRVMPPKHHQYQFDGNGDLVGSQADQYCLYGNLTVKFTNGSSDRQVHVAVKTNPTRRIDIEEDLDELSAADTTQQIEFTNLPIGDVIVEVTEGDEPPTRKIVSLYQRQNETTIALKDKKDAAEWSGTYESPDKKSTITLSSSGETLTGSDQWVNGERYGNDTITDGTITGHTAKANWKGEYLGDPDKVGHRHGTLQMTLDGDTLSGEYDEDEPTFDWNVAPYESAMHKGAVWPFTYTRRK